MAEGPADTDLLDLLMAWAGLAGTSTANGEKW